MGLLRAGTYSPTLLDSSLVKLLSQVETQSRLEATNAALNGTLSTAEDFPEL